MCEPTEDELTNIREAVKRRHPQLTEAQLDNTMGLIEELLDGIVDWADAES